jgi:hypothetical protein
LLAGNFRSLLIVSSGFSCEVGIGAPSMVGAGFEALHQRRSPT